MVPTTVLISSERKLEIGSSDVYPTCFNGNFMSFMLASTYGKAARWPYENLSINVTPQTLLTSYQQKYTDLFWQGIPKGSTVGQHHRLVQELILASGQPGFEQLLLISHLTGLYHTIHNPYGVPINVQNVEYNPEFSSI